MKETDEGPLGCSLTRAFAWDATRLLDVDGNNR